MPSDPTAEQAEVRRKGRQRLVGAVVLALLAVVFVPMALDPEPRRDRAEPALAIPSKNAPPASVVPSPAPAVVPAQPAAPTPASDSKPAEPPPADAAKPEPAPAKPVETAAVKVVEPKAAELRASPPATKPASAPVARAESATVPKLEGFAVQVGAFREDAKLQDARGKLKAARIAHYTERIAVEGGTLTRLRAGPYPTREAAEKAAAAAKKAGIEGRVVPLP
ncbi:MAG: SPOR domain-containing protein [Betaproteobacteria bacterium]|nr:SPOR domain-containing protein [Betaproteobacteria bacterium]